MILASVENIPLHLRPTMYPHPPWMDLLPLPVVRERAVMMQVAKSSAIDMVDEGKGEVERGWRWEIVRGYFLLTPIICEIPDSEIVVRLELNSHSKIIKI